MSQKCNLNEAMLSKIERASKQKDIQKAVIMAYMCGAFNQYGSHGYRSIFDCFGIWEEENLSKESFNIIFDAESYDCEGEGEECGFCEKSLSDNEDAVKKLVKLVNVVVFDKLFGEESPDFGPE